MNNKKTIATQFKPSKNKLQQLFFVFIKKAEFLLAIDGFSSETPTVCCRHYPASLCPPPLFVKKGNFSPCKSGNSMPSPSPRGRVNLRSKFGRGKDLKTTLKFYCFTRFYDPSPEALLPTPPIKKILGEGDKIGDRLPTLIHNHKTTQIFIVILIIYFKVYSNQNHQHHL